MGVKGGPDIETDGLVFHLDAAARNKSYPVDGLDVEYLVVAGGGAGGRHHGGGGGAGGLLYGRTTVSEGTNAIVIGAGGARDSGTNNSPGTPAGNGQNSTAFGLTAVGGGGGGQYNGNGSSGGSGGGPNNWNGSKLGGAGTSGQGFSALNGSTNYNTRGGGGGAGGSPPSSNNYNDGGIGKFFGYTFGISLGEDGWFAGGGAAGTYGGPCASQYLRFTGRNTGGRGGGADGGYGCHGNAYAAYSGQANTGGGGGGEPAYNSLGGNGGSGIVIIKYKGTQKATGGDSIITSKGFTIHVFTSSGNFVVGDRVGGTSSNKIVGSLENMGSNDYKTGNKGYFSFDGSNQAIKLTNFDVSTLGGNFTICSLIKPISSISLIFSSLDVSLSSQTKNVSFYFHETASYGISANAMRLQFGRSSWAWQVYGSNGLSLSKNNWYFVAVTAANLNTSTHTIKFYVNDQVINGTKWTAGLSPAPINYGGDISNSTFLARNYTASSPTYANTYHEINIANLKIYNKTLSNSQILDNYNATKGRFGL